MGNRAFRILTAVCRIVLACTFVVSGFLKAVDPWGTYLKINEYLAIYGLESLRACSMAFSIWLCGAELMMGCMLLFKVRIRLVSIFALVSIAFFTLLTLLSATWIPVEDCGCFGDAVKLTPWQTFAKNLVLLPMAFIVWRRYRPDRIFAFKPVEVLLTLVFFCMSIYLGIYCYRHLPLIDFLPYKVGVDISEAMHEAEQAPDQTQTVLVYRNRNTGELREFTLDDTQWQDESQWEWVDTRTDYEFAGTQPLIGEFALHDASGDVTEEILAWPGRVYLICVTSFDELPRSCERRIGALVRKAEAQGALVVCLTPQFLDGDFSHAFDGGPAVRCCNIDASTMKTMLRAQNGVVELEEGVIRAKKNCRDIRP